MLSFMLTQVHYGINKQTGKPVAMKFIAKEGMIPAEIEDVQREIDTLKNLNHPNIVELLDDFETDDEFCLITAPAEGQLHIRHLVTLCIVKTSPFHRLVRQTQPFPLVADRQLIQRKLS